MSVAQRRFRCGSAAVFRVLADGWLYPSWVVGASRMRDVDESWPEPPARLRHSVGAWPLLIDDSTSCVVWEPPKRMVFQARGWPIGEARVEIEAVPHGDGCLVRMREEAVRGPGRLVPQFIADPLFVWRNREALRRLAFLAEGREAARVRADLG